VGREVRKVSTSLGGFKHLTKIKRRTETELTALEKELDSLAASGSSMSGRKATADMPANWRFNPRKRFLCLTSIS
jgi:hypothetical protein